MNAYTKAKKIVIAKQVAEKELKTLQQQLRALGPVPKDTRVFDFAIPYFNVVTRFQDKNVLTADVIGENKALKELALHIENSGRDIYGIVRSKPGEEITANNLYLGNIFGYWTFTIADWKKHFEQYGDKRAQEVISAQIRGFIESHLPKMIELIDRANIEQAQVNVPLMQKIAGFFNRTK